MGEKKSSVATELGNLVLPSRKNVKRILAELEEEGNPQEVADRVLEPFHKGGFDE